jgi:flagellin-like hook-associated protein FlgL
MSVSGISSQTSITVQSLVDMRNQLDDLQQQLGTGQKSQTYAGMGIDRGFAVGLRAQTSAIGGYDDTITTVGVRLTLAQTTLGRLSDIGDTIKNSAVQPTSVDSSGTTLTQQTAYSELDEVLGLLNTQAGDRYLFSGRASTQPAVDTLDHILNGNGAQAGLKQVISERNQADLGASGLGRLTVSTPALTPTEVDLTEDPVSPFGLKLSAVNSTLGNATVAPPSGSPAATSVNFTGLPQDGQTIQYSFNLPDGTSENLTLTATSSTTPAAGQFTIGPDAQTTATNLRAALTTSLGQLASTSLSAASAVAASNDFFGDPPQRVAGPPFATATSTVAGTSANTVMWYTGEDGSDPARSTATAKVDPSISVSYGMRANEQGIRAMVQNIATLAAVIYSASDPNANARAAALGQRVGANLDGPPGTQKVQDIQAELAGAQQTLAAASDRHQQTKSTLADMLSSIEGVPNEQVAAQIMALQTALQASLQTTSLLFKTSLVNYMS